MTLIDEKGNSCEYKEVSELLNKFFDVRFNMYSRRKEYVEGMLGAEACKLDNIARFIVEKIEGKIKVENLKMTEICRTLKERNYDPDPIKKIAGESGFEDDGSKDYSYLLEMPICNLTMEKKEDIMKQQKEKRDELEALKSKTPTGLWEEDLSAFLSQLEKVEHTYTEILPHILDYKINIV